MTYTASGAVASHPAPAAVEVISTEPELEVSVPRLIVTIDGPAGTGKSSVSRELAARLGLDFLDTGSMYRAATALALDRKVSIDDDLAVAALTRSADLRFDWSSDPPTLLAFDEAMTDRLRAADVTAAVSPISQLPAVRAVLVELQQRIGLKHPRLLTEGRDQGSVVFPDANVKIYLDAHPRTRAERRAAQLRQMGRPADVDAIEQELAIRDQRDSTRAVGPLRVPQGAIIFDTSTLDQQGVVRELERIVREAVPGAVFTPRTWAARTQLGMDRA